MQQAGIDDFLSSKLTAYSVHRTNLQVKLCGTWCRNSNAESQLGISWLEDLTNGKGGLPC